MASPRKNADTALQFLFPQFRGQRPYRLNRAGEIIEWRSPLPEPTPQAVNAAVTAARAQAAEERKVTAARAKLLAGWPLLDVQARAAFGPCLPALLLALQRGDLGAFRQIVTRHHVKTAMESYRAAVEALTSV